MQTFKHNDQGAVVGQIQTALNFAGPTRLPRLAVDNKFGALTTARVMEFQFRSHLTADGIVGPLTNAKLPSDGPGDGELPDPPKGRSIFVNLFDGQLTAYEDGNVALFVTPVKGGRPGYQSDRGVFQMSARRLRNHSSSEFPAPPGQNNMNFSLFYNGGEALHQGDPSKASHGCIHVPAPYAEQLFEWAGKTDIVVIVAR